MSRHHKILARAGAMCCALLLAGCDDLPSLGGEETAEAAPVQAQTGGGILRVEEREVERPDIYATQARGLWDGRFSLGGRWIAVADNVKAERIRITNVDTGRVVEGALFQREANLPGPPLMVSMDAAQALGMQAGAPADLKVVVLRTETVEIPAAVPLAPVPADTGEEGETDAADETQAIAAAPVTPTAPAPERTGIDAAVVASVTGVAAAAAAARPAPDAAPALEAAPNGVESGLETSTLETTVLGALDEAESAAPAADPAPVASGRHLNIGAARRRSILDRRC
ncbi:MAG: hypothetical protein AAGF22_03000, partial [Pseudomonadota bacterium]